MGSVKKKTKDPQWCGCGSTDPETVHKREIRALSLNNRRQLADHADRAVVTVESSGDPEDSPSIYLRLEADARPVARVRLSASADEMESGIRDLAQAKKLGEALLEAVAVLEPHVVAHP